MYYHINYDNYTAFRVNMRRLLLLAAVITDFFAFYSIVDILIAGPIYVLQLFGLIALSTAMRIVSGGINIKIDYVFREDTLTVTRSTSFRTRAILEITSEDKVSIIESTPSGCKNLALTAADNRIISLNGTAYRMQLDEYMLALLLNNSNLKEGKL